MNPFEMVVIIVLIVVIGRVVSARYGLTSGGRRGRGLGATPPADDGSAEAARLRAEVTRLNDRIQVLERIATDPAKRLSDEIEQLKNK